MQHDMAFDVEVFLENKTNAFQAHDIIHVRGTLTENLFH